MPVTVTLGTHTVPLKAPPSACLRREVVAAIGINTVRGLCATLGVCWAGKALKAKYNFQPLPYGGEVFDELMALGIPDADIYAAAGKAIDLCLEVPTEAGVARAEGFTAPQKEDLTP